MHHLVESTSSHSTTTSRETIFDSAQNLALVPVFFAPRTRETFSPGL